MNRTRVILDYHEATKHHFHRYARSAGYMDWTNQPDPYRTYEGAEKISLPIDDGHALRFSYADLFSPRKGSAQPLNFSTIGTFLLFSMALSAWKAAGASRWSLRINPSSGNLHPTECYLVLPPSASLAGGVYHYHPLWHALESRMQWPHNARDQWDAHFHSTGFLVGLSSIFWREAWKYGERAYRYCNLDVGHALGALAYAARLNNWAITCLSGAGDDQIGALLGFNRTQWAPRETDAPDLACWVCVDGGKHDIPQVLPDTLVQPFENLTVRGRPNRLSRQPVDWEIISQAARAAQKDATSPLECSASSDPFAFQPPQRPMAADIIRRRRSAAAYDPGKSIAGHTFLAILDRTRPRAGVPPFDVSLIGPMVDLLLFVHRVEGVHPGLYIFSRTQDRIEALQAMFRPGLAWRQVRPGLPLWLLREGDVTYEAMEVSCHQEIAGHGAFAVAMLAPLKTMVTDRPFIYRHLHWECGMIGQVLYLEAEAHNIRGTGIGCFFDQAVNELAGIEADALQSLYHFTIGHPIEDRRIQTLPAYHHLDR